MNDIKQARVVSGLIRLRQRMRMMGSAMISVDPHRLAFPFTLAQVFTAIEVLDAQIKEFDSELDLSGGGGDQRPALAASFTGWIAFVRFPAYFISVSSTRG